MRSIPTGTSDIGNRCASISPPRRSPRPKSGFVEQSAQGIDVGLTTGYALFRRGRCGLVAFVDQVFLGQFLEEAARFTADLLAVLLALVGIAERQGLARAGD